MEGWGGAGKIAAGVELFYRDLGASLLKLKKLGLAKRLQFLGRGGGEPRIPLGD